MASTQSAKLALNAVPRSLAEEYDHQRLDRLRELRAVIDTLRQETERQDPLLNWVMQANRQGNPRAD